MYASSKDVALVVVAASADVGVVVVVWLLVDAGSARGAEGVAAASGCAGVEGAS